jgi:hypothetical protein
LFPQKQTVEDRSQQVRIQVTDKSRSR